MSSFGCASQYESAYSAKRLGVWETADASKVTKYAWKGDQPTKNNKTAWGHGLRVEQQPVSNCMTCREVPTSSKLSCR